LIHHESGAAGTGEVHSIQDMLAAIFQKYGPDERRCPKCIGAAKASMAAEYQDQSQQI
jgi:hypothetical protein